ncbi:hypothetical protein JCM1840_000147 [Sporobolomyces johnsonii]
MPPSTKSDLPKEEQRSYILESHVQDVEENVFNDKALLRKIDRWLITPIAVLYLLSFLDRSNIGNAVLFGLKADLGLKGNQYNVALAVFYAFYVVVEPPANAVLKRWRAGAWISLIMFLTAVMCISLGFVTDYVTLMVVRALLGLVEGGLYPGIMFMIQMWYRRDETAYRSCLLYASGAFGGLIARAIQLMDGTQGLEGWRWIFIIEGTVTAAVAILCFFVLPDSPSTARFLTSDEKTRVVERLKVDTQSMPQEFDKRYVWAAFTNPMVYCMMFLELGSLTAVYVFSNFAPTIVNQGLGFTATNAQLLVVPPYVLGCIAALVAGIWSDKVKRRFPFVVTFASVALIGFIILLSTTNVAAQYIACCLVCMGSFTLIPLEISWNGANLGASTTRAVGIAMQIGCANTGGIVGAFVYRTTDSPRFVLGHSVMIGFLSMTIILATGYYIYCKRENERRDRLYGTDSYHTCSQETIDAEKHKGDKARWFSPPSLKYTEQLENRILELEGVIAKLLQSANSGSGAEGPSNAADSTSRAPQPSTRTYEEEEGVEVARLAEDSGNRRAFHGPSSLFYLLSPSSATSRSETPTTPDPAADENWKWLAESLDSQHRQTLEWLGLIRVNAEVPEFPAPAATFGAFLSLHWQWVQPFFGFVYRQPFLRDMSGIGTNQQSSHFSVFLLFAICAHVGRSGLNDFSSIEMVPTPESPASSPASDNPFLRQARLLLWQEVERDVKVSTIQGLLLLSAKECSEGRVGQSWTYTGMAIRMVQDLGIHLDGRRTNEQTDMLSEEFEVRRRVFWTAYIWEKWISLYFGRTPMLRLTRDSPKRLFVDLADEGDLWTPVGTPAEATYQPVPSYGLSTFSNNGGLSELIELLLLYDLPDHLVLDPEDLPTQAPPSHITNLNCAYFMITILVERRLAAGAPNAQSAARSTTVLQAAKAIHRLAQMNFDAFGDRPAVLSHCYSIYTAATTFLQILKKRDATAWPTPEEAEISQALSWSLARLEQAALSGPALIRPLAVLKEHLKQVQAPPVHPLHALVQAAVPSPSSAFASFIPSATSTAPYPPALPSSAATAATTIREAQPTPTSSFDFGLFDGGAIPDVDWLRWDGGGELDMFGSHT